MSRREHAMTGHGSRASSAWSPGRAEVSDRGREQEPARKVRTPNGASTGKATNGLVRARRRRYLSARSVVSLIALASLIVPGIVAVIAAALAAF